MASGTDQSGTFRKRYRPSGQAQPLPASALLFSDAAKWRTLGKRLQALGNLSV